MFCSIRVGWLPAGHTESHIFNVSRPLFQLKNCFLKSRANVWEEGYCEPTKDWRDEPVPVLALNAADTLTWINTKCKTRGEVFWQPAESSWATFPLVPTAQLHAVQFEYQGQVSPVMLQVNCAILYGSSLISFLFQLADISHLRQLVSAMNNVWWLSAINFGKWPSHRHD